MKNVTIPFSEDLAEWARVEAARQGKSLARFLNEAVEDLRRADPAYREAMDDFFSRSAQPLGFKGRAPRRETLYDRQDVRGHEPLRVHEGPQRPFETKPR